MCVNCLLKALVLHGFALVTNSIFGEINGVENYVRYTRLNEHIFQERTVVKIFFILLVGKKQMATN